MLDINEHLRTGGRTRARWRDIVVVAHVKYDDRPPCVNKRERKARSPCFHEGEWKGAIGESVSEREISYLPDRQSAVQTTEVN